MKTPAPPLKPKTILIPLDGSSHTEEAVRSVQALSPPERVLLLHTISLPQLAYPGTGMSVGHNFSEAAETALREEGARILEKAASLLPPECGKVFPHLENGIPASIILSMAEHESVDLIIMGSRGLGTIQEHLIGSVSHRIATHASCHILLVKAPVVPFNNILLLIEHPLDAEWAIEFLSQKPFRGTPHITVLHVIPFAQPILPIAALLPDSWKKELQDGGARLTKDVADKLSSLGYSVESIVEPGAPFSVIQRQISRLQPQLVLMGTPGRKPLQRLAQGSVSHATIHHSPCSVLLIREPTSHAQA
ncbi:universal stress protein [Candidatus Nitrospira allomarina]|uniref:Universal stress protein n=1 Tax=Candidatus Nitrospira allomarina TaxID=3020900 RepID=A0AA96GLZ2_9BACT|nr:universal stress protein [Candidatus Nitrospira allomarina]WNM59996.1 universal stress protein [Candidatus Nitrospira allomarina]